MKYLHILGACTIVLLIGTAGLDAAELQPGTIAAFERYVAATEQRTNARAPGGLWLDSLPESRRQQVLADLRQGRLHIERLRTKDRGRDIDVPDGLIHHWIGTVFIPGGTTDEAVRLMQDYDRHASVFAPMVEQSRLLTRDGDRFTAFLRFRQKRIITVVINSNHEARFTRLGQGEAASRIVSTRIAEVEDPGGPGEREKPVGQGNGYVWRLNTYWRFVERNEGVYLQCESITLTRDIPLGFGWLIGRFVTSVPRESLTFTLETTRRALTE